YRLTIVLSNVPPMANSAPDRCCCLVVPLPALPVYLICPGRQSLKPKPRTMLGMMYGAGIRYRRFVVTSSTPAEPLTELTLPPDGGTNSVRKRESSSLSTLYAPAIAKPNRDSPKVPSLASQLSHATDTPVPGLQSRK